MRKVYLLVISCLVGSARLQTETTFYTKLSSGCEEVNISRAQDCPFARNYEVSKWNITSLKTQSRFQTFSRRKSKCYYKLKEQKHTCNAIPTCVMTTYSYILPRLAKGAKETECTNKFSISTDCNANGLENITTVYSECFKKVKRTFCSIDFQPCKAFEWTDLKLQCYVTCNTSRSIGVAKKLVRKCKSQRGQIVNDENCPAGITTSKVARKCLARSTMKATIPMCDDTPTTSPTTDVNESEVQTTTGISKSTASTVTTFNASSVRTATTVSKTTQPPDVTKKPVVQRTNGFTRPITTSRTVTEGVTTAETKHVFDSTPFNDPRALDNSTAHDISSETENKNSTVTARRAILTGSETLSKPPLNNNNSLKSVIPDVIGGENRVKTIDLLPVAGGAGAGLLFVFAMALIIVLLVRRKDNKSSAVNSILSSTSSYRTRYGRNPVVDSGSFRIATWIRERPSLPNGGSLSPSESVVSDAEYWKAGESVDDLTARYVQDRRDSKTSEVPDVVKNVSTVQENIYDEVYSSDDEGGPTTSNRASTPIATRSSSSSNQAQNGGIVGDVSLDKNAIYALVQKSRKKEQMRKRSSATSMGASRRRIASQHSVTNLHGKQLRDGVLQIEFNDEQGVKFKLSESDTYIDLEEDELPSVF